MYICSPEVTCHVLGWAKVDWTPSGRMSDSSSDHYRAEEGYINKMFNLYGIGDAVIYSWENVILHGYDHIIFISIMLLNHTQKQTQSLLCPQDIIVLLI